MGKKRDNLMKIKVLGSSGAEFPGHNPPGFLIDGNILFDAGTIGACLSESAQWKIRHVVITHAHLDHIRGIPFLADNIIIKNKRHKVTVIGIKPVLKILKENLLNNKVWPDFTMIPDSKNGIIRLHAIIPGMPVSINGHKITAYRVSHSVPAAGYVIEDKNGKRLLYTGDTGPTKTIWEKACKKRIHCAIIEVSFPDSMKDMALSTGHLTPGLFRTETEKMDTIPDRILITHPKPQHIRTIGNELRRLGMPNVRMLKDGEVITV